MSEINSLFRSVREASRTIANITDAERNAVILTLARLIEDNIGPLLEANAADLARMSPDSPLYDRLRLTADRLGSIATDMRNVAA